MKFWTQHRDDETVWHVTVALTREEAWNLRHSLDNMLGLNGRGRSGRWPWSRREMLPSSWPKAVSVEPGWHEHVSSDDYQTDLEVMPDFDA